MIPTDLVKSAKQSLGERAAEIIVNELNIEKWNSNSLKGCCPIHEDKTPSFSWNKKNNSFKCFGCGASMDIISYYTDYRHMNFIEAVKELFRETNTNYDFEDYKRKEVKQKNPPLAEKNSDRLKVESYMGGRGISKATLAKREIKQDSKGNIVFEYRNQDGDLNLVKYRPARLVDKGENKLWCQKDKDTSPLLFGMDKIDTTKPLLITEGEIDSLACIEAGYSNAVSVPFGAGSYAWIEYNWDWLNQFEKIIIWSDNDEQGEKMKTNSIPRLGEYRCYVVKSKYKDANIHLLKEGKESVIKAIEQAEDVPIKDIAYLADAPDFDLSKSEKIKSGINGLDKWIGGFVLGSLSVITGINSSGKSTLINQMCIAEAIEQGYNTFIFSEEISMGQLRNWFELTLAGPDNIKEFDKGLNQPIGYAVIDSVKPKLREWYKEKVILYNNEDDVTSKSLLKKMEEMAKRYGIKNYVIDNLMMVDLESNGNDDLKKQKEFTLSLKRFARRYNAVVHLVAHPRKLDAIKRLNKLDVAGTGDITNLADYVTAIHRVLPSEKGGSKDKNGKYTTEPCPYDNIIDLFKNRPASHQDKAIGLHFDMRSKRIYGDSDDVNKIYSWRKGSEMLEVLMNNTPVI
jgi:KaiC/GvpD/RAD55 family RecA-like ATPase